MLNLILRPLLFVAAIVAGWFVEREAVNFSIIQMVVALLLITALVGVAAFWELISGWISERSNRRN